MAVELTKLETDLARMARVSDVPLKAPLSWTLNGQPMRLVDIQQSLYRQGWPNPINRGRLHCLLNETLIPGGIVQRAGLHYTLAPGQEDLAPVAIFNALTAVEYGYALDCLCGTVKKLSLLPRLRLLEFLAAQPHPVTRLDDFQTAVPLYRNSIAGHLRQLDAFGFVDFSTAGPDNKGPKYHLSPFANSPYLPPLRRGRISQEILDTIMSVVRQNGKLTSKQIVAELQSAGWAENTTRGALTCLVGQDRLRWEGFRQGNGMSKASITEDGRWYLSHWLEPIEQYFTNGQMPKPIAKAVSEFSRDPQYYLRELPKIG